MGEAGSRVAGRTIVITGAGSGISHGGPAGRVFWDEKEYRLMERA